MVYHFFIVICSFHFRYDLSEKQGDKGQEQPTIPRQHKSKPGVQKHKKYDIIYIQKDLDAIKV